jgi:hypothetical protein
MPAPVSALVPTITDVHMLQCAIDGATFYAALVETLPGIEVEIFAGVAIAANTQLVELEGVRIATLPNGGAALFANAATWIGVTGSIAGISIFRQIGMAASSSDQLFSTMAFVDSAGLLTPWQASESNLPVGFDAVPFFVTRRG